MARRSMSRSDLLQVFAGTLERLGVKPGTDVDREAFDDLVMVGCEVGPDSVQNYVVQGRAQGYWSVEAGHGRKRGYVTFLGVAHAGAVA